MADTGIRINDAMEIQFRDPELTIHSSADGQLDINADTTLQLTSATTNVVSNAVTFGAGSDTDIVITFNGNTFDGVFKWMEDEDYFEWSDDILLSGAEHLYFRDTGLGTVSYTHLTLPTICSV